MFRPGLVGTISVIVLVVLIAGAWGYEETSLRETLLAQEHKLMEAIRQRDEPTIRQLLSQESYAVTAGGGRQTGQQMLTSLDDVTVASYSFSDVEVVEASDTVGILTYRFTWAGSRGDRVVPATTVYATSVWALRDGEWMSVFYQETPITE